MNPGEAPDALMLGGEARTAVRDLAARHVAGFAINFAGSLFLARSLGPTAWGTFTIAYVALVVVQGLIERGTVGYLVSRRDLTAERSATALVVQAAAGVVALAAVALTGSGVAAFFGERLLEPFMAAVALSAMAYAVRAVPLGLLERELRYRGVGVVEVADLLVFNLVAVVGVAAGAGLEALVIGMALRGPASAAVAWSIARPPLRGIPSRRAAREMAAFALPYSGSNVLAWINLAAAPILVGGLAGPAELGLLQLAYTLVLYPQLLTTIVGRVAFPVYARAGEDVAGVRHDVERSTRAIITLAGTLMLVVASTSALWVPLLYGPAWSGMVPIITTVAAPLGVSMGIVTVLAALSARRLVAQVFAVGLAYTIVYWSLGTFLVPRFGALGLTITQVISTATYLGYLATFARAFGQLSLAVALGRYALACGGLVVSAVLNVIGTPPVLLLPVAAAAAAIVLRPSDLRSAIAIARGATSRARTMRAQ